MQSGRKDDQQQLLLLAADDRAERVDRRGKQHRKRKGKRTVQATSLTISQVAALTRGVVTMNNQRRRAERTSLARRFFQWRTELLLSSFPTQPYRDSSDNAGALARSQVLFQLEESERLYKDLADVKSELFATDLALRANGRRVVLRQFIKQRLFARIQRAFTTWLLHSSGVNTRSEVQLTEIRKGIRVVEREEGSADECRKKNASLRFALLVYVFHLKWKTNSLIALLQHEREKIDCNQRCLWNEVCALKLGLQRADEYEAAVFAAAHLRGDTLYEGLERLRAHLQSLPKASSSSSHSHRSHRHHNHHHHSHRHNGEQHSSRQHARPNQSRSPSPESRSRSPARTHTTRSSVSTTGKFTSPVATSVAHKVPLGGSHQRASVSLSRPSVSQPGAGGLAGVGSDSTRKSVISSASKRASMAVSQKRVSLVTPITSTATSTPTATATPRASVSVVGAARVSINLSKNM